MANISLSRNHNLSTDELRTRLDTLNGKLKDKFGLDAAWDPKNSNVANVQGKGVKGKVVMSPSSLSVDLSIGMLLRPLKGKIETALNEELDKVVAP